MALSITHAKIAAYPETPRLKDTDWNDNHVITGTKTDFDAACSDGNFLFVGDAPTAHTHSMSDITGLAAALAGKSDTGHGHAQSDITGLVTDLGILATAISGKANASHTHAQSDITNLTTDLAAKAPLASPTFTGTVTLPAGQVVNGVTLTTGGSATDFLNAQGNYVSGSGSGTVTSVSVATANGFSASVANPTTTPTITIDPLDFMLKGSFVDVNGWSTQAEDFIRGNVIADYGLSALINGTAAATTVNASTGSLGQRSLVGFLQMTTGTTAAGFAGAATNNVLPPIPNANLAGSIFRTKSGNVIFDAPTGVEDFDCIMAWINESLVNNYDENLTTGVQVYFRMQRGSTNYKFRYVDNTNTMITIDTGVAWSAAAPKTFETEYVLGASAAASTVRGWIDGVLVASATGVRLPGTSTLYMRPGRIEKLAGVTARILYIDSFHRAVYCPQRWY